MRRRRRTHSLRSARMAITEAISPPDNERSKDLARLPLGLSTHPGRHRQGPLALPLRTPHFKKISESHLNAFLGSLG